MEPGRYRRGVRAIGCVLAAVALIGGWSGAYAGTVLELPDGRRLHGEKVRRVKGARILVTVFGELRVPEAQLTPGDGTARPAPLEPGERRETRTRWFVLDHDLSPERERLYADGLDAFVSWMAGVYGLDRKRLRSQTPFKAHVYRLRADFRRVQDRVAPGIARRKGQGFAEGVAGFAGRGVVYLWDTEGGRGGVELEVAKHETTHMLNRILAEATGMRFPVWFEEGTATYFEAGMTFGGKEPEDNVAALATAREDLGAGRAMKSRDLRSVPYETFYSREYAWGCCLVRFLRRDRGGRHWKDALEHLRTIGEGAPSDSQNDRFVKALGYRTEKELDEAWHASLRAAKGDGLPHGASAGSLSEVAKIAKPTPEQARSFGRIGTSLARKGLYDAAVVYLRAALRGELNDARLFRDLADALARLDGRLEDDAWPDRCVDLLKKAVAAEPLRAAWRFELGRQLRLRAETPADDRAARDTLGLGLLLAGPNDDVVEIGIEAIRSQRAAVPGRPPREACDWLGQQVPDAVPALRVAYRELLLREGLYEEIRDELTGRAKKGEKLTRDERSMLADLFRAGGSFGRAADLYRGLLEERPGDLHHWPVLVECLVRAGRRTEARLAREEAYRALEKAPGDPSVLRQRLERIDLK